MTRRALSILLFLSLCAFPSVFAADYQVIINTSNPTDILPKETLAKIFLKKLPKWDNGTAIVPVDQAATAPVRIVFTKLIHGKTVSAIGSYWQQQIFAGKDVPPAEKQGDAAVIAFVKATPGAIGYIGPGTAAEGVKVVTVR